jgi:DNA-binding response OmpR family regulator
MVERILVIEDDESVADIIALNLRQEGYEVEVALNGKTGLEIAMGEDFDLVMCDIVMPDMDGYEVCRRLKAEELTGRIPFIFLTALTGIEDKVKGLDAGADDFITKPFDFGELLARINMNLDRAARKYSIDSVAGLPGNITADDVLRQRVLGEEKFALLIIRIKGLRPFRTVYGDAKIDEVVRFTADIIREVISKAGSKKDFAAYVGAGSFSIITRPNRADTFGKDIIKLFDQGIRNFYAVGDLERGSIVTFDRRGGIIDNPIMTVIIGASSNTERTIGSHWEAAEIAREVLVYAMSFPGSTYLMDRRKDSSKDQ